ncbi:Arf GTPase arl1 [Mortierella sp. NVP41]|nr:Arf GTPase arl1 [Mortierella sp. NVP41]
MGLDGVGKTQILLRLQTGQRVSTTPSLDIDLKTITVSDTEFSIKVLVGTFIRRGTYSEWFMRDRLLLEPSAVIWVVNSADRDGFVEAKEALWRFFEVYDAAQQQEVKAEKSILLVLANKQDVEGAMSIADIKDELDLEGRTEGRRWHIQGTETIFGSGLEEAFAWLDTQLSGSPLIKIRHMGNILSTPPPPLPPQTKTERYMIKVMGPTSSGKTSILRKIQHPDNPLDNYSRTFCDPLIFRSPERTLTLFFVDTCDREQFVAFNGSFLRNTQGIIVVVDASTLREERDRYVLEGKRSLERAISDYANTVQDLSVLVFANKQDQLPSGTAETGGAATMALDVIEALDLENMLHDRRWFVQEASALRGEGIVQEFAWLLAQMQDRASSGSGGGVHG